MITKDLLGFVVAVGLFCGLVIGTVARYAYDDKCVSYGFDKGALLTTQGVFCERTVTSSWEVPYLPLEGARRVHEYLSNPDPRYIHAPTQTQVL